VTYTLDVWYYRGDRTGQPEIVATEDALDAVLAYLATHEQPHPAVIAARELPKIGPLARPDRLFKLDVDRHSAGTGALHYLGPDETVGDDAAEAGMWVTRTDTPIEQDGQPLFIDRANQTEFPRDAVLPMTRIRAALLEFTQTGKRPTCVDWQDIDVY